MKNSFNWDCVEQHKFWGLIRSELAVSTVQVQELLSKFFWLEKLDANASAIAVEGLLTLCSCCPPMPKLVGAVMLLPNSVFQDFASAVMAKWAVSNGSMLFESLAEFSEKVEGKNGDLVIHDSAGMINRSAILWLLKYFNGSDTDGLCNAFHWKVFLLKVDMQSEDEKVVFRMLPCYLDKGHKGAACALFS
ncbi:hypothetical protein FF1_006974 [Malus domestica]